MAKAKQLPSGSWRVQLYIGMQDGKRVYRSFTGPSKRQVEAEAAAYAATEPLSTSRDGMTLKQAMDEYIETKRNVLSPSSIPGYKSIAKNHLEMIRDLPLYKLTQDKLQAEINREAARVSPKTVRNIVGLLTATLNMFAPAKRYHLTLPQRESKPVRIPTREEIELIYANIKGGPMEVPVLLAAACGMRRSEICALRLADVGQGTIRVTKALVEDEEHDLVTKVPKTYAGTRIIDCSTTLTGLIKARGKDPVCELTPDQISDRFRRLLDRLGISHFRFHDLRHYYASEGLLMGVPTRYVADMMGHASVQTTERIYQHVFAASRRELGQALAERTNALLDGKH